MCGGEASISVEGGTIEISSTINYVRRTRRIYFRGIVRGRRNRRIYARSFKRRADGQVTWENEIFAVDRLE